jgi:putative integral membrane protein (TIGR02587 family)
MRGVTGGVLLGVPLLYTQETWLHGRNVAPVVLLTGLVATLAVTVALSYFVGFRPGRTHRPIEDAVVGMGLSLLISAVLLVLLDRVGRETSLENALGVTALTAIPVSLGFSLGAALAPIGGGEKAEQMQGGGGDLLVAAGGALVFALNIAPTAEPIRLAAELDGVRLGLLVVASVVRPYLMVFFAEFGGREERVATDGATIHTVVGGSGPPVLLLHGAPQSHVSWHRVAVELARDYTVVACDLRGYGDSSKQGGSASHVEYSKRTLAADQVAVMRHFGFERFCEPRRGALCETRGSP